MIEIENVKKVYKGDSYETTALDDISLKINDGEFVAIMGKSGSGKTTLLNIIGGMDSLTEGKIIVDGKDISRLKGYKLDIFRKDNISFVFQNYALMQQYTVYENIELPLNARDYKSKDKKKIIYEAMEKLGIKELAEKFPKQISGGEQQRTAIARAMVSGCRYILADEPTGALDGSTAKELMRLFKLLHENGKTLIVVTHDAAIAEYAERKIILADGKIENAING